MENNLIDRQAAINALDGNVIVTSRESAQAVMDYIRECADRIRSLPSAQPDHNADVSKKVDLIDRQEAKRALEEGRYSTGYCKEHGIDHSISMEMVRILLNDLPSAQPELIEKAAYIRGFEQGRTQGMIDTKAEEVAQPNLQPTCNQLATDTISRQAAIDAVRGWVNKAFDDWGNAADEIRCFNAIYPLIKALPSAQPDIKQAAKLLSDFIESCPGGDSYLITPDGEELITDWGYAEEGIQLIHDWAERRTDG